MTGTARPLVSIVIPVFNGADHLGEAIASALAQTYPAVEVLVVDDGSTDDGATARVAQGFGSRIRYLRQTNGGVAAALNRGIAEMRGDVFSWLSHDDLYLPRKVERQVAAWQAFGAPCVVVGDFATVSAEGRRLDERRLATDPLARPLDGLLGGLLNGCAMLIPRAVFDRIGRFDPGLPTTQDYHLWFLMAHRVPFVHVAAADVLQRLHPGQGSRRQAHLEEAGQLFIHILGAVPAARMVAYEGSETAFLLRHRERLQIYPGVAAYIDRRVAALGERADFALVLLGGNGQRLAAAVRAARAWATRPRRILGVRPAGAGAPPAVPGLVALPEAAAGPADAIVLAAAAGVADWLLFAAPGRLPTPEAVQAMLAARGEGDADLVLGARPGGAVSPIEHVLVRRDAAAAVARAVRDDGRLDPGRLARDGVAMAGPDAPARAPGRGDLRRALAGQDLVPFQGPGAAAAVLAGIDAELGPRRPRMLFLCHDGGGGTLVHLRELLAALGDRIAPVIAFGSPSGQVRLALSAGESRRGVVFEVPRQHADLLDVLRRARLRRLDILHVFGFEAYAERLVAELGLPYDVTLVDYHHFARHPHLVAGQGRFCGDAALGAGDPGALRPDRPAFLARAERIVAISRDLAHRVGRIAPELPLVCAAHWGPVPGDRRTILPPALHVEDEPLRVLLLGGITPIKGSSLLADAARIVRTRQLPIRFHVVGSVNPALPLPDEVVTIHPAIDLARVQSTIAEVGPHLGWLPAQAPETWSYALSDLIAAGLPIAACAIGAIPERCAGRPATWLLPWTSSAAEWVDLFLRLHATALAEPPRWMPVDHLPPAVPYYPDSYLAPLAA